MNRLFVVIALVLGMFTIAMSGAAFAHGVDDGQAIDGYSMVDVDNCDQDQFGLGDLFEVEGEAQPPMSSSAKTYWTSAAQCQNACRSQGCSGYHYVSNGNGDGTCSCSGCSW